MDNIKPTKLVMVSLLSTCGHLSALSTGKWFHAYICNHPLSIDVILGNSLIDTYFKMWEHLDCTGGLLWNTFEEYIWLEFYAY